MTIYNNCGIDFSNRNLTQYSSVNDNFTILSLLPSEVLQLIARKVTEEPSLIKSAIRAVELGRTCLYFHKITHDDDEINALIHDENKFDVLVGVLQMKMDDSRGTDAWVDFDFMSMLVEENSIKLFENKFRDISRDYINNHPGLDFNAEKFVNEYKTHFVKKENLWDLSKVFYAIFKKTIKGVLEHKYSECVCDESFVPYVKIVSQFITSDSSLRENFRQKIYQDTIDNVYSKQPLNEISIEEYKLIVEEMVRNFPEVPQKFCELHLRQALCRNNDINQFATLREEYANPNENTLSSIKEKLKKERREELRQIECNFQWLRGDNGLNGAINAAYQRMLNAEVELNDQCCQLKH